jgi:general secretion pathway protein A
MYNSCWGLKENPFSLSPDPAFFYRSQQHEEAFANLIYGVESRKGFIALTGEVGTGKTTVLECLRDCLRERKIGYITVANSRLSPQEFFELIACELRCEGSSKAEVLSALNQLLVQEAEAGRTMVLIVDEAQNLERDVLEEIRLLGNLEDRYGKLLQIVLAGQPELDRKLDAPDLRQLKQRIVLRCTLRPLTEKETLEYVATRLERAGMPGQRVFPPHVLTEIHRVAQGVPRVINAICDNLLVMTCALRQQVATIQMLAKVGEQMRLDGFSGASEIGPAADPAESAAITRYKSEWTREPRFVRSELPIAPAVAAGVTLKPLPPLPRRHRRAVRFVWTVAAVVAALGGLTLAAANDLWGIRQFVPDLWPQVTSAHFALPESASPQSTSLQPTSKPSTSEPRWRQPTPSAAPLGAKTPRIETPPGALPSWRQLNAKAYPPPTRKPVETSKAPTPEPLRLPAFKPAQTFAPSPGIALATPQSEPAPRRDPEVVVDPTPAPQVIEPAPPAAPPPPPPRFTGGWSYPSNGRFYGAEPEFVELAIREDNGHLMGGLSVRFKPASGGGSELLQFGFSGDLRSASIQTFSLETKNGDRGTIELIPGSAPNTLEVNFHTRRSDGRTQSGNMILVKRAASSL